MVTAITTSGIVTPTTPYATLAVDPLRVVSEGKTAQLTKREYQCRKSYALRVSGALDRSHDRCILAPSCSRLRAAMPFHITDNVSRRSATTFTVSSGSERVVQVYPERRGTSSGGSASVHSPTTSSGGRSVSSRSTESWSEVEAEDDDDGIEPSDSASRSRDRHSSRRQTTEVRPAPTRRHSSRRAHIEREESPPPRLRRRTTHTSSRHRRSESRRTPSDESGSVASYDEHYYSHHGAPQPPRAYPPNGYRHGPPQPPGGYPPSIATSGPYMDPYAPHQRALVPMQPPDAFGGYQPNPFLPAGPPENPFSPMSQGGSSYFGSEALPPQQHAMRPPGPPRPQSYAAPPSHYGSEMAMAPYGFPGHAGMVPAMGMPGAIPPYGFAPPPMPWQYPQPPSHTSSPAPIKEDPEKEKINAEIESLKAALASKDEAEKAKATQETESLKKLIKKYEEAQAAAEAAAAAKRAEEEAEKKKKAEIAEATKKVKEAAEKEHEKKLAEAKKAQEAAEKEHAEKLAEAKKAQEEAEKAKKELEEEAAKNKPAPDTLKAPIKFKDAVGRKFSFPFHICKTWKGMESLIRQAFAHVDVIGDHVLQGHYDLTGPDGEIILPQVWETMIQPDWEITMHMWPFDEHKAELKDEPFIAGGSGADPMADLFDQMNLGRHGRAQVVEPRKSKKGRDGKEKKKSKSLSPDLVAVAPGPAPIGGAMPPPPTFPPGVIPGAPDLGFMTHDIQVVPESKARPSKSRTKSHGVSGLQAWLAGGSARPSAKASSSKKDDEKLEPVRRRSTGGSGGGGASASGDQTGCLIM